MEEQANPVLMALSEGFEQQIEGVALRVLCDSLIEKLLQGVRGIWEVHATEYHCS